MITLHTHAKKSHTFEKDETGQSCLWYFETRKWVILLEEYSNSGSAMTREKQRKKLFQMVLGWNNDNRE